MESDQGEQSEAPDLVRRRGHSDNGRNLRSAVFAEVLAEAIKQRFTRTYRSRPNGKAKRFNRTLADEFLDAHVFRSEKHRRRRLEHWVHIYNCHRNHTAIGGPPSSRVRNVTGHYT
jgi:transposase InsO family protein